VRRAAELDRWEGEEATWRRGGPIKKNSGDVGGTTARGKTAA
jgi:hypothetical protein